RSGDEPTGRIECDEQQRGLALAREIDRLLHLHAGAHTDRALERERDDGRGGLLGSRLRILRLRDRHQHIQQAGERNDGMRTRAQSRMYRTTTIDEALHSHPTSLQLSYEAMRVVFA